MQNRARLAREAAVSAAAVAFVVVVTGTALASDGIRVDALDRELAAALSAAGFTGRIEASLEQRLGRRVDAKLADIGRLLWFDAITSLNDDNPCAGCHAPANGFGDSQPIAIGIDNNGIVGVQRFGPRNMRRSPMVLNTAFYPKQMWNSRFVALSGDPFKNDAGFAFPAPESLTLSAQPHLLTAQAFIPPTERTEMAGFAFAGDNNAIRDEVMRRINAVPEYRFLFGQIFAKVKAGAPVTYDMFARAIAEFEFSLNFADAPIDRFARGERNALSDDQKRGALLFFGAAGCASCHRADAASNEMFSDFADHVVGVPQVAPALTNTPFDGPGRNEDFGREQFTGDPADRYKFRTAPLRNIALQPAFMHNGAFAALEDAIRHHLDATAGAAAYPQLIHKLPADLRESHGPIEPVLARLDPRLAQPVKLSPNEFDQLVAFVREGLLDRRATPERLLRMVPKRVPSGRPLPRFEGPAN